MSFTGEEPDRVNAVFDRLDAMFDRIEGRLLTFHYERRGPAYFSPIARRLRVVEPGPLADLLDDAVDDGRLSDDERAAILLADVILTGRKRPDGQDVYLAVEVSVGIGPRDVERAAERATLLEKLGRPVLPVVAGEWINQEAVALAQAQGVWYVEGGRVTAPVSA